MADSERLVSFELLGQKFSFYTEADEEEMAAILSLVREQIGGDSVLPSNTVPASKIAMMACLKMASRYLELEREYQSYRSDAETRSARLSQSIKLKLSDD